MIDKVKIKIEGLNLVRLINDFVASNIYIENLVAKQKYISFYVSNKDVKIIDVICKKYHKKYKIIQNSVKKQIIGVLRKSLGFLLAIIISFAFLFSHTRYIFCVNISCESKLPYDLSNVKNVLNDAGIVSGMMRKSVNINEIQNLVISSVDDVSGCSVKRNGGNLEIVVYPSIKKAEVLAEDIVSKYSGIITSVDVFSGVSKVNVGDIVKPGDVLIENQNGASGKICAKVFFSDYILFNENQVVEEFSGNEFESYEVVLFKKFVVKPAKKSVFSNFKTENCVFWLSKNLFVPISFEKKIYKETCLKEAFVSFESQEEKIKQELMESVLMKAGDNKVVDFTFSIVREENFVRVDCNGESEIDLAL